MPQGNLLAILNVVVELQPPPVNKVLHFYHPQNTFLKKHILVQNKSHNSSRNEGVEDEYGSKLLLVRCSDSNAFCQIKQIGKSLAVFLKVSSSSSAMSHTFYIMVYNEKYLISPCDVWLVSVHALHRMDHGLILGQSSVVKLTLRGNHINRRVACYSHTASAVKVSVCGMFNSTEKYISCACIV